MSRTPLTTGQVLALSPDEASSKAAKGLMSPAKWLRLGASDEAVWGECQGSGSQPYQIQVDVAGGGSTFRCSCPSHKFPCKHGLALLLLQAQDASRFTAEQPAWVGEWLTARRTRVEKKEAKAEAAKSAPVDPAVVAKAAASQQKREQQRWQRMQAGAAELGLWLNDLMRQGLAGLSAHDCNRQAATLAARMVDAQASGLGQRLTQAMTLVGLGRDWPTRLLAQLGSLQLLLDAVQRIDTLPAPLQAEVRQAAGWPLDKDTVLAEGEALSASWQVCGLITLERDERLGERRAWFYSPQHQRHALVLDFSFAGQGFAQTWHTGQQITATLRFYPGMASLRALVQTAAPAPDPVDTPAAQAAAVPRQGRSDQEDTDPAALPDAAWLALARCITANPWSPAWPLLLHQVRLCPPARADAPWTLHTADDRILPLAVAASDVWPWLAHAGAAAMTVFGEWDGQALHPLTAWHPDGQWTATAWAEADSLS